MNLLILSVERNRVGDASMPNAVRLFSTDLQVQSVGGVRDLAGEMFRRLVASSPHAELGSGMNRCRTSIRRIGIQRQQRAASVLSDALENSAKATMLRRGNAECTGRNPCNLLQ